MIQSTRGRPNAIGVVLPVRDEQALLPRCLAALRHASAQVELPVHLVVVLDACTDRSAEVIAATPAIGTLQDVLEVQARSVGAARAAGCAQLLARFGRDDLWLANTDADSAVEPGWLRGQLRYAERGYDAVAGTVTIDDWTPYRPEARHRYDGHYRPQWGHRHVHGANLGVHASAYVAAGGFPALATGEDVVLVSALLAQARQIAWAHDLPVRTSSRHQGRAPSGLSHLLRSLAADGGPLRSAPLVVPPAAAAGL